MALIGAAILLATPEPVSAEKQRIRFDIPRQRADGALTAFGRQADISVLYQFDLVKEYSANRLKGDYTVSKAVELLLKDTGLQASFNEGGHLIIAKNQDREGSVPGGKLKQSLLASIATILFGSGGAVAQDDADIAAEGSDAGEVEEIVVVGRVKEFYRVEETTTGMKTPTDLLDIPQSIQVLSQQLIADQAARQVTDLYRSVSGVTQYAYSAVTFRGFRQEEIRYDGVRGDPFSEFAVPHLFNIERVEFLKGPSGMLYGGANPGGLINNVTKKPTADKDATVSLFTGSYDLYGLSGEYSGAVTDDERLRIRLGGFYQTKKPFRNNTKEVHALIDVGLEYEVSDRTSLLLQATYMDQDLMGHRIRGVPVSNDGEFLADISWSAAEPTDFQTLQAHVVQARVAHEFTDSLTTNFTARYISNERDQRYHEPRGAFDSDADGVVDSVRRQQRDQERETEELSFTLDTVYQTEIGGMAHTILVGGDYFVQDAFEDLGGGGAAPLSLANPVYGTSFVGDLPTLFLIDNKTSFFGIYLQDQVEITDWFQLVGGLRYDDFKQKDKTGGLNDFSDSAVTFRGGGVFKPWQGVSLYLSYSEGFRAQGQASQFSPSGPFDPEESVQYEAGVKGYLFDDRVQAGMAIYQITKENLLQADPDPNAPPNSLVSFGRVRAKGVELDLIADVTSRWVFMANYAYNDTRIIEGAGTFVSFAVGDRFANAPEHTVGLWTRYDIPFLSSAIAGGMDYVSERINFNGQDVKSYVIFDLSWQTQWKNLSFQINMKNLLNDEYQSSGFTARGGNFPGEPRTVLFQVSAKL